MQNEIKTPLFALAISMAYEIQADQKTSRQEKARLITLFGKLVEMNVMGETELQTMTQQSFAYASTVDIDEFIEKASRMLTGTQKLAIVINLYDTMQVDGNINMGERATINKFRKAFGIDDVAADGIKMFLTLKNDTSIFIDQAHPLNNTDFNIKNLFTDR